ncbi:MAG TPA: PSD1 and planctomycete cytochrome C domain-containing protein, partial [Chthoniobacteraceae bacterium]|nr:PSD1 and planctomycete cytochrome C domain-containing protein [Chthoniobacteraceae bacterium]
MPSRFRHPLFVLSLLCLAPVLQAAEGSAQRELSFERDVRPIFKKHCFQCHGEGEKLKGGLDLRLRRFMVLPDEDGHFPVVPGEPAKSELVSLVRDGEMPKKAKPLAAAEVALLEQWVAQGAKTLRPEPEQVPKVWITEVEREFWAFQPLHAAAPPAVKEPARVRTPIDAFLLAKLEAQGLSFAPDGDKRTLLRRLSIDLTGLPPSPEEVDLFLSDDAPDAYERLVDRLLASPHYGERWGRHWLDVAGYADSDGYTDADPVRIWAFKYRDYVIRAFNADKPFDQFIREQLAGDEMVKQPYKNLAPADIEKLTATGFLRTVPDGTSTAEDQTTARNAVVAETIKVVSSSLLGMTVGCAQCHDHRLDPIPQADYYRMRAIFEPGLNPAAWKTPPARLVSLQREDDKAKSVKLEAEAHELEVERLALTNKLIAEALEEELEKKPEELREPLRTAYNTELKQRTPEQVKLLKEHPTVNSLTAGSLYLYDRNNGKARAPQVQKMTERIAEVRAQKPVEELIPVFSEPVGAPLPETHLFYRGDPGQPKDKYTPGELTVLASFHPSEIPEKNPATPTTGRRLALAKSLTDGTHPLTTRVLVNRAWHHHFGHGLVGTLGDFGSIGERPSHPELLDWLARQFVTDGWSMKKLHRLIVCSTAYRQSSVRDPAKEKADPDNRLLGRMNVRRIEAEVLRDSMLAVSGKLNSKMFGAPVPVMTDPDGQVVVGINTNDTAGRPSGKFIPLNGEEFRRSVYVMERRSQPLGMLETFDLPRMDPNCELRTASTVAPQSLAMMNGDFTLTQAKFLAERVSREAGPVVAAQAKRAWLLVLATAPSDDEVKGAVAFLEKQTEHFKAHPTPPAPVAKGKEPPPPADPALQALATFCQALLTANGFL